MGSFREAMAHAFAVGPKRREQPRDLPPTLERAARGIVARGLESPAIMALASLAPLGFLGGQAMLAAWPIVQALVPGDDWREVALLLEERETPERFAALIEQLARETGSRA